MPSATEPWLRTAGTPGVGACDDEARRGHASKRQPFLSDGSTSVVSSLLRLSAGGGQAQEPPHPGSAVDFRAVGGQLGLPLHARSLGRVLHQQEGLLGLAIPHDALLVLRLADALQPQVAPAAQDQGPQGSDGDEDDDDRDHTGGGAVVHDGHG